MNLQPRLYPGLDQNQALNSEASSLLIRALAGTGKTTTLAIKAVDLIRTQGARKVLMLAYSEAGIKAIQARLDRLTAVHLEGLHLLTLEQFCACLLEEQGDPVPLLSSGLEKNMLIEQAHEALRQEVERHKELELPELTDYFARPLDISAFLAFEAQAKQRMLELDIDASGLAALAYCRDNALDYGLYRLLRSYERLRSGPTQEPLFYAPGDCTYALACQLAALDFDAGFTLLQGRFEAVLFDELQDLDEAALLVLRHLARGNGRFIGVGDFNQHILPGASSIFGDSAQRILQELPAGTSQATLNTTYRFGPLICQELNRLFGVEFEAHYRNASAWFEHRRGDDEDCARQLLDIHATVARLPRKPQDPPAVLRVILRSPEDSIRLEWLFAHEGVHYACKGMQRFYQRREIALVLAMLWAMPGCSGTARLSQGILNSAAEGLMRYVRHASPPDRDLLANGLFDMSALGEAPPESDTLRIAAELMGRQSAMRRFLAVQIAPDSAAARLLALPAEQCADAGQLCRHPLLQQFFAQAAISREELRQCLASLQALSQICAGLTVDEFLGRLSLMVQSSIAQHQRQEKPSLQLLTVERSKGHEYDYVAVPFVHARHFSSDANDPQRNLLYVAMTRASKRLWVLESN
ncbi:UvrD-helicase domain-containing protein [Comamonas testosteroni]|uniref:DNA 3'-5' helicase II n=1 Tax=Comamonas testosteroni (strain DSM 14576 / KF-1) TaxID=399795 RepID=B7WRB2_COMTK|nr:UvrD-helicase domain-containing protein [Comamonas testosteroni]EED65269.1 UvrD/REP helicase [Comamonas testosteroni KF-1]WQG68679.1 UvrD-helicase domain-containing protein [Comamonas testosteroni]